MKVCLTSPTCADSDTPQGGGERYVEELAKALSEFVEVVLVSFGRQPRREMSGSRFERRIVRSWTQSALTPFSPKFVSAVASADVVHAFQYFTLPTFVSTWLGHKRGSRVFVSDLGGGGWTPGYHVDISRWIDGHLPISRYAARALPGRPRPVEVIYGGVDLERFACRSNADHDGSLVFLGRLLPHKGVHLLIEALPPTFMLHVIGPVADPAYLRHLKALASHKSVAFHHDLNDAGVVQYLQRAMALVHPTPVDESGDAGANELFGLALAEAMACGCPVIASDVASLPEVVGNSGAGILVRPGDPSELVRAIEHLAGSPDEWRVMSGRARYRVEERFTWRAVAERCLRAYERLPVAVVTDGPQDFREGPGIAAEPVFPGTPDLADGESNPGRPAAGETH